MHLSNRGYLSSSFLFIWTPTFTATLCFPALPHTHWVPPYHHSVQRHH